MKKKLLFLLLLFCFSQNAVVADSKVSDSDEEVSEDDYPAIPPLYKTVLDCPTRKGPPSVYVEDGTTVQAYGPLLMGSTYNRPPRTWMIGSMLWDCHDVEVEVTEEQEGNDED